jgi:hypothetical protein
MRRDVPRGLAPVLFVIGCGLLGLAWAMTAPGSVVGRDASLGALRAERVDDLALWLACIALATAFAWRGARGSISLSGLAVALTPTVVMVGAVGGHTGLVVAAAIALAAGLLRLVATSPRPRPWVVAGTAGAAVLVVVAAPTLRLGFAGADGAARETWRQLWRAFAAWTGRFPGDGAGAGVPLLGVIVWTVALLALVLAADRLAGVRGRRLLWLAAAAAVVLCAVLFAGSVEQWPAAVGSLSTSPPRPIGPVVGLALVPPSLLALLAGDLVSRAAVAWWPRLAAGCLGLLGLVHVLAFVALRDQAHLGGTPWIAAVLLGALALAAAGAVGATGTVGATGDRGRGDQPS